MDKTSDLVSESKGNRSIEAIQADIEHSRNETVKTINELERRLSPSKIKDELTERARQLMTGKVETMANYTTEKTRQWGSTVYRTIKENPIPVIMMGGGAAWLIANTIRGDGNGRVRDLEHKEIGMPRTGVYNTTAESPGRIGRIKAGAQEKGTAAKERAMQMSDQVRGRAAAISEQAKVKAGAMGGSVSQYGYRIRRAGNDFLQAFENNPLAAAGLLFAAGAAVGLALPESRYESERMGPMRDDAIERAREIGREQTEKAKTVVKEAAENAKETLKEEAEKQGFVEREKSERAEEKAKETAAQASGKAEELKEKATRKAEETKQKASTKTSNVSFSSPGK